MRKPVLFLVLFLFCIGPVKRSFGQLILTFSREAGGGVNVTGIGTGSSASSGAVNSWTVNNLSSDFLSDSLSNSSPFVADSVLGSISSTKNGSTSTVNLFDFSVSRNAPSSDFINWTSGVGQNNKLNFPNGSTFDVDFSATYDSSTLSFDDLIVGSYTGTSAEFGTVNIQVSAVPEPGVFASFAVLGLIGGVLWYRRRKQVSLALE